MPANKSLIKHVPYPLDYNVQLPAVFKVKQPSNRNNPYDSFDEIPIYSEEDERDAYTLQEVLDNFASFVKIVTEIATSIRDSQFDTYTRETLLDHYYGCDWADWDIYPSKNDNYYYVLATPELRGIELVLEMLQARNYWDMDVAEVRRKVNKLKLELWQCLPDFYKGHANPMPRPLTYDSERPYPHIYIADDFIEGQRPVYGGFEYEKDNYPVVSTRTLIHTTHPIFAYSEQREELGSYLPDDTSQVSAITLETGKLGWDLIIKTDTGISVQVDTNTYDQPQLRILDFLEAIISNRDPSYFNIDPEGPLYEFLSDKAAQSENVKLVIAMKAYDENEYECLLSGVFNRRQLAAEFMKICEDPFKYFGDVEPTSADEYAEEILHRLARLKAIM